MNGLSERINALPTWTEDPLLAQYLAWLKQQLGEHKRFEHSLGVCEAALALAEGFGLSTVDRQRAAIAGLLHDSAKLMPPGQLFAAADTYGIMLSAVDKASPQTLHPAIGAEMVKHLLQIGDEDVLNAIRYHTTGRAGMSTLEKIVYIADKTEYRTRNPQYIADMTAALDFDNPHSLDITCLKIIDDTLQFLLEKQQPIHPETISARNDLLAKLKAISNQKGELD